MALEKFNGEYPKSIALTLRMCEPYFSTDVCYSRLECIQAWAQVLVCRKLAYQFFSRTCLEAGLGDMWACGCGTGRNCIAARVNGEAVVHGGWAIRTPLGSV
eukprot:6187633-Pleurochrysis_carterae.AAC.1